MGTPPAKLQLGVNKLLNIAWRMRGGALNSVVPKQEHENAENRQIMNIIPTELTGLLLIEPKAFGDSRGCFFESYHRERYLAAGIDADFVQDNCSRSCRGTLRGLHYQLTRPQGKLVFVTRGEVVDVPSICDVVRPRSAARSQQS